MEGLRGFFSRHREGLVFSLLLLISLSALAVQSQRISSSSKDFGYSIFSSFQHGLGRTGLFFEDLFQSIRELRKIREEYELLQEKLNDYSVMERQIIDLKQQNARLRELLDFTEQVEYRKVAARIIAKEAGPLFNGFTINKGSTHGIVSDTAVIAYTDGLSCLVGKITEVSGTTSKILPITDSSCYVAVRMRDSRYEGLMNGLGSDSRRLEMRYVKKQARDEINYGDLVITSGLRSIYPENIYVGRIVEIEAPEWESSLTLEVQPLVEFTKLEYVVVLLEEFD
jgi:rod shape-determining protein MreC